MLEAGRQGPANVTAPAVRAGECVTWPAEGLRALLAGRPGRQLRALLVEVQGDLGWRRVVNGGIVGAQARN